MKKVTKKAAYKLGDFIELVNRWFDSMNYFTPSSNLASKRPYGMNLESQNELFDITNTFTSMKCIGKEQVFQKGLLISTKSTEQLFIDLRNKYSISYLITQRLNQDYLEHFFPR